MVHSCLLCGKRKTEQKISFFHFPKKKEERERWILLCQPYVNLDVLKVTSNTRICQRHFSPNSVRRKRERARLRRRAEPSIFFEKRVSYRKTIPLPQSCEADPLVDPDDSKALHGNHFLVTDIPNDLENRTETYSKGDAASCSDAFDFRNSLDFSTVDSAETLPVPASEFVEVQMETDSRMINEDDIENICIPRGYNDEDDYEGDDDDAAELSDCVITEPHSPDCIEISSGESVDECSTYEMSFTIHNDHTYCKPSRIRPTQLRFNNLSSHTLPSDLVDRSYLDVMRVSLAHYKNSTKVLQDRLRVATKKLETLEHAIHELGFTNKISKNDMEQLLFHINPTVH